MYYYECRAIEVSLSAIILTLNAFECRAEWKTCAAKQHNFRTLFQPYLSYQSQRITPQREMVAMSEHTEFCSSR